MRITKSFIAFALTLAAFCAVSCNNKTQEVQKQQVTAIVLKDTTCTVNYQYPATLSGIQDVDIYPQVSGRITAIRVKEGQLVNKGDVLFEIDDVPYKSAYDAALAQVEVSKAQLETAKLTYQSKLNLYNRNIISEYQLNLAANDVATAEAVLGQSNAALKSAANELSFTKVRTTCKGLIGAIPYRVGSLVSSSLSKPLTIVSDNSEVYASFSITENDYLSLGISRNNGMKEGLPPLHLITNLGTEYEHEGHLHSASGLISNETGSIIMKALFPNPDRRLLSGGACRVVLRMESSGLIVVPRASMKEIQNKMFLFVIRDGKLVQTEVNAERLNANQWVLIPDVDGNIPVKAGDLITTTTNRMFDGAEVEVIK